VWVIVPVVNNWAMTEQSLYDLLGQSIPTRILVAAQGVDPDLRTHLEKLGEKFSDRVFCVFWNPPIPSLSGVWNRCLDFVWSTGDTEALVVNNDVRLHRDTYRVLKLYLKDENALFVSAVGVLESQFDPMIPTGIPSQPDGSRLTTKGGPDFSCFLIARECHHRYRLDERFIPSHCEDLDYHRRLMLDGEGARIFSINLPFLHYGAQTLKHMAPDQRAKTNTQIESVCRAYYRTSWGGPVNQETYLVKGDPASAVTDGSATTPCLQAKWRAAMIDSTVTAGGQAPLITESPALEP
jgi:hypothetical protein